MKLEEQVVSLKLAKQLKKLGVKQESYFVWVEGAPFFDGNHNERDLVLNPSELLELTDNCDNDFEMASAFTVAELGRMLPIKVCDQQQRLSKTPRKCFSLWQKGHDEDYVDDSKPVEFGIGYGDTHLKEREKTEADARSKMLIYLLENNFIYEVLS